MNRLNQTEPATFSILSCWAFFRDSVFIYAIILVKMPKISTTRLGTDHFCKKFWRQSDPSEALITTK
jgi:hypothetical protein